MKFYWQNDTKTFGDFADGLIPIVKSYLADSAIVDVLFERYLLDSIKNGTRIKRTRGTKGIRRITEGRAVTKVVETKYTELGILWGGGGGGGGLL